MREYAKSHAKNILSSLSGISSVIESFVTSTVSPNSAQFTTVNRRMWQVLVLNFIIDIFIFVVVGFSNGRIWPQVLIQALPPSLVFTAVLWRFFSRKMFHRRYVISPEGVSMFYRGSLQQHISWADVSHITRNSLSIHAHDGRSIILYLPTVHQRKAEKAVDSFRQAFCPAAHPERDHPDPSHASLTPLAPHVAKS